MNTTKGTSNGIGALGPDWVKKPSAWWSLKRTSVAGTGAKDLTLGSGNVGTGRGCRVPARTTTGKTDTEPQAAPL